MANILSEKTKNIDRTLEKLAAEHKRTDIKSVREGESQPGPHQSANISWGKPGQFPLDSIQSVRGEPTGIVPGRDTHFRPVRPSSVIRDHENLQLPPEALEVLKKR